MGNRSEIEGVSDERWAALGGVVLLMLGLLGPGGTFGQGTVRLTRGKIVIGIINDPPGVFADFGGKNAVEAARMAVEDFRKKYGANVLGGPIEVISAEHQNNVDLDSSKAAEFYDRDGVNVIFDVPRSSVAIAVANVAAQKHRLFINVTAATPALTNENCNKYTFHYTYDTYMLANGTATEVTKQVGKNWYIIYPNYLFGQDMNRAFTQAIAKAGGRVRLADATPFPIDDFSTYLIKARGMYPLVNVLGSMHFGQDLANLVKQYNEFGLRQRGVNLAIGLLFLSDVRALGVQAFQGALYTTPWEWTLDRQSREFADRFLARTKVRPTFAHAGNYSAAWQYLDAVRRTDTDDPDRVVRALEGYKFSDFFIRNGEIRAQDHRVIHDAYLARVKAPSEVEEPWDYVQIISKIPAAEAFKPLSQSTCKMAH